MSTKSHVLCRWALLDGVMDNAQDMEEFDWNARRIAGLALVLLVPTVIASVLVGLSRSGAARCVESNVCSGGSGPSPLWTFAVSAVAGVLGLVWPRRRLPFARARVLPVSVQLVAQLWMACQIVTLV